MWNINYTVMMKMEYFLEQNELFSNILAFSVLGSSLQCCASPPLLRLRPISHSSLFKT